MTYPINSAKRIYSETNLTNISLSSKRFRTENNSQLEIVSKKLFEKIIGFLEFDDINHLISTNKFFQSKNVIQIQKSKLRDKINQFKVLAFLKEKLPSPFFPISSDIKFCLLKTNFEQWLTANIIDFRDNYWKDDFGDLHILHPDTEDVPKTWENLGFHSISLQYVDFQTAKEVIDRKDILCIKDSKIGQIRAYLEEKQQNSSENIAEGLLVPIRLSTAKYTASLPTIIFDDPAKLIKETLINLINKHEIISFMNEEETLPIKYQNMKFCWFKLSNNEWTITNGLSPSKSIWIDQDGQTQHLSSHKSAPKDWKFKAIKSVNFAISPPNSDKIYAKQVDAQNILCFGDSYIRRMKAYLFRNNRELDSNSILEALFSSNLKQLINNHLDKFQVIAFKNTPEMNSSIHDIDIDTQTLPDENLYTCLVKRSELPYWSKGEILKNQDKTRSTHIYVHPKGTKYYKDIWYIPSAFEPRILNSLKTILNSKGLFTQDALSDILCSTYED